MSIMATIIGKLIYIENGVRTRSVLIKISHYADLELFLCYISITDGPLRKIVNDLLLIDCSRKKVHTWKVEAMKNLFRGSQ